MKKSKYKGLTVKASCDAASISRGSFYYKPILFKSAKHILRYQDILDMYAFRNLQQVRDLSSDWLIEYNYDRGHDSLGGKSPVEYARSFPPFTPQQFSEGAKRKKLLRKC